MILSNHGIFASAKKSGIFAAYAARVAADGGVTEAGTCVNAVSGISLNSSLLLVPSGYKSGVVYSEIPTNGDGDLTFTRASDATRVNSDGEIEVVGSGIPRLDYSQGSCPALLLEPQRTNLVLHSQNYGDSSWIALGSTKVSTTQTDPSGGSTAVNVTWASGAGGYLYRNQTGLTVGTTYTITFYVRSDNGSSFRLYAESLNFSSSNFTATSTFERFTFTYTATTTSGTFGFRANTSNSAANLIIAFAQFEVGAYATSYIPTTSATVTRLADSFSRNNIYTNGLISSSGGTWFVELKNNVEYTLTTESTSAGLELGNSTGNPTEAFKFRRGGGTQRISIWKIVSGTTTFLYSISTDNSKVAIKWNGTSADVFVNGTKVVSATSFTATTSLEVLRYIQNQMPHFIQAMQLYPTPLSDSDCISLTT